MYLFLSLAKLRISSAKSFIEISEGWRFETSEYISYFSSTIVRPFGQDAYKIFARSQAMTGFGSAIGKLIDFKKVNAIGKEIPENRTKKEGF